MEAGSGADGGDGGGAGADEGRSPVAVMSDALALWVRPTFFAERATTQRLRL